ncbi:MAG TPA: MFS transporter [Steroidobacteraceae bacterium]|nr:MFS transporter [Steroidobacteraceae bacterium]
MHHAPGELSKDHERIGYPDRYKRLVTLLLMAVYAFNSMDRSIITIIGQPMKLDLRLSDTQLGVLSGTAFAALYAVGGIPMARLAERLNRVNLMAIALTVWSGLTALCGLATSFGQLLLTRVGVGFAESGCAPPAHSLISDYFPPDRRASALSVYSCGISLGYVLAAVAGGFVAQHLGWRAACAVVGLPGLALAVLLKVLVREPAREGKIQTAPSLRAELNELGQVGRSLLLDAPVLHMVLGVTIGGFAAYGFYAFLPPYFSRAFSLDYTTIGFIAAVTGGVAVGAGILAGGFIADRLASRSAHWYALVPALGTLSALPLYLLAMLQTSWPGAAWLLGCAGFFQYASLGPTFGVVQNAVDPSRRATATAVLYICLSVLALGGGPPFTGWVIDRFVAAGAALPLATRRGLLVCLLFFAWASIHYFLAIRGIAQPLRRHYRAAPPPSPVQSSSM